MYETSSFEAKMAASCGLVPQLQPSAKATTDTFEYSYSKEHESRYTQITINTVAYMARPRERERERESSSIPEGCNDRRSGRLGAYQGCREREDRSTRTKRTQSRHIYAVTIHMHVCKYGILRQ